MADATQATERFTIICRRCDRSMLARAQWIGWEVYCPHCSSLLCVPEAPENDVPVLARGPYLGARYCFNFACPRCECLLETHTGMHGTPGTCPACAARFTIPYLHERTRRPLKAELIEGAAENPTPVHAYGASGAAAPRIVRMADDALAIQCPNCDLYNQIDADICENCRTPFTMEAVATVGKLHTERWVRYSITSGIISIIIFPTFIPGLLAAWWGARAAMSSGGMRRSLLGLIGLALGVISFAGGVVFWYWKLK